MKKLILTIGFIFSAAFLLAADMKTVTVPKVEYKSGNKVITDYKGTVHMVTPDQLKVKHAEFVLRKAEIEKRIAEVNALIAKEHK